MIEGEIKTWFQSSDLTKRLATIPGIGYLTAAANARDAPPRWETAIFAGSWSTA